MKTNYYQKYKEKLEAWKEACRRYQNLSEEEQTKGKKSPKKNTKKVLVTLWVSVSLSSSLLPIQICTLSSSPSFSVALNSPLF